jgi:hypothetical protein
VLSRLPMNDQTRVAGVVESMKSKRIFMEAPSSIAGAKASK